MKHFAFHQEISNGQVTGHESEERGWIRKLMTFSVEIKEHVIAPVINIYVLKNPATGPSSWRYILQGIVQTSNHIPSCRTSLHKFLKISSRSHSKHKPPTPIGDNSKVLGTITIRSIEKCLKLFQRRIHSDDLVNVASSPEFLHDSFNAICLFDWRTLQQLL